jgi:hypothetical protein
VQLANLGLKSSHKPLQLSASALPMSLTGLVLSDCELEAVPGAAIDHPAPLSLHLCCGVSCHCADHTVLLPKVEGCLQS